VDNTIGGTPQRNGWSDPGRSGTDAWVDFFREQRLRPQLRLAGEPALQRLGDALCARLPALFEGAPQVRPACLHGDLWSGNIAAAGGAPAVFDPACYYGARGAAAQRPVGGTAPAEAYAHQQSAII
jgi:protein-ribulosamine 3-kinase